MCSVLLLCVLGCSGNGPKYKYRCVKRANNDFVTYTDSVSLLLKLPVIIEKSFDDIIDSIESVVFQNEFLVFSVTYSSEIELYILKIYRDSGLVDYFLIAYDFESQLISKNNIQIDGKWMESNEKGFNENHKLITEPLIYFSDFNDDNKNEIIIKNRVHNGNIYNAVIENIYTISSDLKIDSLLFLETKYEDIFRQCLIVRDYSLKKNELKTSLICDDTLTIGYSKLSITYNGVEITDSTLLIPEYENLLITGSGLNSQEFIRKGYGHLY